MKQQGKAKKHKEKTKKKTRRNKEKQAYLHPVDKPLFFFWIRQCLV